jgi:uncharacterized membrane protein
MTETDDRPATVRTARLAGIDLARALAILGMLAVHVGPTDADGVAGTLYGLTHGRSAILFGLLAGVGVSLLATSRSATTASARGRLVWRALVLLPLGLVLQPLDHGVFVILQDYAVLFLLGAALLAVSDRGLLGLAALSWLGGSGAYLWGRIARPDAFAREAAAWGDAPGEVLHRLVLSGPYPLITWAAPFLLGMWLGRRDLRPRRAHKDLLLAGTVGVLTVVAVSRGLAAVLPTPDDPGWGRLIVDEPHSQMPLWLLGATSSALLVLGACLWVAEVAPRSTWPLVAVGQLAFTVYVGHLLALHLANEALTSDAVGRASLLVLGFTVVAMAVATAWRAVLPRGPLELVLHLPWLVGSRRRRPSDEV